MVPLYIAVLAVSGVSRFLLSALSVALPHVTPRHKLVVANALSDTLGGMMSALGGIVALGINAATGDTERGAAVTMLVGGGCYVAAGLVATVMPRDLLGPAERTSPGRPARRRPRRGGRRAWRPAPATCSSAAVRVPRSAPTSAYSFLFGPLFLMSILLYRNYFYPAQVTVAESHVGTLAVFSAVGYVCAALVTPPATRHVSKEAWISAHACRGRSRDRDDRRDVQRGRRTWRSVS